MAIVIRNNKRKYGEIVATLEKTTCSVCYTKKSSNIGCSKGHMVCKICTNKYVGVTLLEHVGGFKKEEIECPTDGCKEHLGWKHVRELLSGDTMGKVLKIWRSQMDIKNNNNEMDHETEKTISSISKKCPDCQVNIEKDGGCDHVRCRCGKNFYYTCLCNFPKHKMGCASGDQELLSFSETVRIAAERLRVAMSEVSEEQIQESRIENQRHGDEELRDTGTRRLVHLRDTRVGLISRLDRVESEI